MTSLKVARVGLGVYASSRLSQLYSDRVAYPTGLRMVQLCHGRAATPEQFSASGPVGAIIAALIVSGRYLPFAADQGGLTLWGGAGVATDIEAANTYMVNTFGCRSTKFALLGYSMGFLNAAAEVYANPSKIPVVLGVAPATDGSHIFADNAGLQAEMNTAAGGSWASVDATRSPAQRSAAYAGVHVECWQGSTDATIRPADTATFCTAVGGTNHAVAGDHGTVWFSITPADVLAALDAGDWS